MQPTLRDRQMHTTVETLQATSLQGYRFRATIFLNAGILLGAIALAAPASALPPPEDIPEEVLRGEIILEGRSPIDGEPLTPEQYAQLEAQLQESEYPPQLDPEVRQIVFLLQLFKFLRVVTPL